MQHKDIEKDIILVDFGHLLGRTIVDKEKSCFKKENKPCNAGYEEIENLQTFR